MSAAGRKLTNAEVLAGQGGMRGHRVYRELVGAHGHDALCEAYGLDVDAHWVDVVTQALLAGDIDSATFELT